MGFEGREGLHSIGIGSEIHLHKVSARIVDLGPSWARFLRFAGSRPVSSDRITISDGDSIPEYPENSEINSQNGSFGKTETYLRQVYSKDSGF